MSLSQVNSEEKRPLKEPGRRPFSVLAYIFLRISLIASITAFHFMLIPLSGSLISRRLGTLPLLTALREELCCGLFSRRALFLRLVRGRTLGLGLHLLQEKWGVRHGRHHWGILADDGCGLWDGHMAFHRGWRGGNSQGSLHGCTRDIPGVGQHGAVWLVGVARGRGVRGEGLVVVVVVHVMRLTMRLASGGSVVRVVGSGGGVLVCCQKQGRGAHSPDPLQNGWS